MNLSEAKAIVSAVAAHYPGTTLSNANVNAYCQAMLPLPAKDALSAAIEVARRQEWMPTVAVLLNGIADRLSELPTPEAAWGMVQESMRDHICFAGHCEWGQSYEALHPLIRRATKTMGYHRLLNTTNPSADQAQFIKLYADMRRDQVRGVASGELPAAKTAIIGSPVLEIAAKMGEAS